MFHTDIFEFTSTSIGQYIPLFTRVYGEELPLKMILTFKDFDVNFGRYDTPLNLEYTTDVTIMTGDKELFSDEIRMISSALVNI